MRFAYKSLRLISLLSAIIALSYVTPSTHLFAHVISPTISEPIMGWDSAGHPTFTKFKSGTGVLSIRGLIVSFIPSTIAGPLIVGGRVSITTSLVGTSVGGGIVHADFAGGTIKILDINGKLALKGKIEDLTIDGIIGVNIGAGGAIFEPLDGYLLRDFRPGKGGAVHLEFNVVPSWSATSYTASWTSESKGVVGYVPKPVTPLGAWHRIVAQPYLQQ